MYNFFDFWQRLREPLLANLKDLICIEAFFLRLEWVVVFTFSGFGKVRDDLAECIELSFGVELFELSEAESTVDFAVFVEHVQFTRLVVHVHTVLHVLLRHLALLTQEVWIFIRLKRVLKCVMIRR
jgi:hypothetical protein